MMGDFVWFLIVTVLLSTCVAAESGEPHGAGVVVDQGEQPAQELKTTLPEVGSPAPELGAELGSPAPEVETPGQEIPPEGNGVEWQTGSSEHVTTGELGTNTTPSVEDPDFVARFLQQKRETKDQFKGRRGLQRREGTHHSTVSDADKKTIIDMHNDYRRNVMPTARAMVKMYWSDKLADSAQEIADECRDGSKHDEAGERRTKSKLGLPVGQNYALGPNGTGWSNIVAAWYAEIKDFKYGVKVDQPVGHYTQEVRGPSSRVGCGSKECPNLAKDGQPRRSFYCNYAQMNMDYTNPYELGDTCTGCPGRCDDGLCDCGEMLCQFGSIPDYTTCKCTCQNGFSGADCTTCPLVDMSSNCGSWTKEMCGQYTNVRDECPVMCGDCVKKCSNDIKCKNGGVLTEVGDGTCSCTCPAGYRGPRCQCQTAWRAADDNPGCAGVGMDYCAYTNIRDDMCKFKCNC